MKIAKWIAAAALLATVGLADMRRTTVTVVGGTNAAQSVTGTVNDRGLLYRVGVTVNGGSLNVSVSDFDGTGLATLTQNGVGLDLLAQPDPLSVASTIAHSADTDKNFRISLLELTRVIELYNTRNGTIRTGAYVVQIGSEDGFAPDPSRASNAMVTLTQYHSADEDRRGMISLLELTRVIELYNYRSGTTRTGQYHTQVGTEDDYAPGP